MKTIEQRADEYIDEYYDGIYTDLYPDVRRAFIAGAKFEHEELTRWHDPKEELPEDEETVLLRIESNVLFSNYMTGSHYGEEWLTQEGDPIPDGTTILGWREIHE